MFFSVTPHVAEETYLDLTKVNTPVHTAMLARLLRDTNFDHTESEFLVDGFTNGFSLGYQGPQDCQDLSNNIPFTVGDKTDMWNKIMKEIKLKRTAGPFERIPYERYVQSPIGLVPKAGGQTCLIFHLSYKFKNGNESINHWTPQEICSVRYNDIDHAVNNCLRLVEEFGDQVERIFFTKTDLKSAFRVLPGKVSEFWLVIMKAEHPTSGKIYYFVDKSMPFGAGISCSNFQCFSNALKHLVE